MNKLLIFLIVLCVIIYFNFDKVKETFANSRVYLNKLGQQYVDTIPVYPNTINSIVSCTSPYKLNGDSCVYFPGNPNLPCPGPGKRTTNADVCSYKNS